MFKLMTDKDFVKVTEYYTGNAGKMELETFWNWVYTSFSKYVETGDTTHLNRVVVGSRNVQRYRPAMRVIGTLAAHKFNDSTKEFDGKAIDGKLEKLRKMVDIVLINNETGEETESQEAYWIGRFEDLSKEEAAKSNKTPDFDATKWEAALLRLIVKGLEHGENLEHIQTVITKATSKVEELEATEQQAA